MNALLRISLVLLALIPLSLHAQLNWEYQADMDISFAIEDTAAVPYLCATDNKGNLWVISSGVSVVGAKNALYMAAPGDTLFTLIDDYANDLDVETPRGITTMGDSVYVICRKPDKATAIMLEYPDGDINNRKSFTSGGYGTWIMGLSANKDHYIYAGISYLTSIRVYDFRDDAPSRGWWVPIDPLSSHPNEPGGHDGASLTSKIRDVAVIPGADYSLSTTPFFSSRESDTLGQSGGIAVWAGGTQTSPIDYVGTRVTDVSSDLSWLWWTPYGLVCDAAGNLYACGTDSLRRWVKSYSVFGNFAVENEEFPSQNSTSSPVPSGAAMEAPTDIALSPDETWAYIIDMDAQKAFVFHRGPVRVEKTSPGLIREFQLFANYPNPFNPETVIGYQIPVRQQVEISVYNLLGIKVTTLVNGLQNAGLHQVRFNATNLASGIYYSVMRSGDFTSVRKMMFIK